MSKPHKYHAKPTFVDGIRFASMKEATRYGELKLLEKAGVIARLELQRGFPLYVVESGLSGFDDECDIEGRKFVHIGAYVADFCYDALSVKDTRFVIEDVKGFKTPLYRWKKKHVEAQYGITIVEI